MSKFFLVLENLSSGPRVGGRSEKKIYTVKEPPLSSTWADCIF